MLRPRMAIRGSRTTKMAFVRLISLSRSSKSRESEKVRSYILSLFSSMSSMVLSRNTFDGSPPAASMRGLMVSSALSSGAIKIMLPCLPGVSSGIGRPVDIQAAILMASSDLPIPGSPSSMVIFPRGIRLCHSQSICCALTPESLIPGGAMMSLMGDSGFSSSALISGLFDEVSLACLAVS